MGFQFSSFLHLLHRKVFSKLVKTVFILLTFFTYGLLLIPTFLLLMSPLYLYRLIIRHLAPHFRPDFIRMVNTRDGIVGLDYVQKRCHCVINIMLTYRGKPDLAHLRHIFQTKVLNVKYSDEGIVRQGKRGDDYIYEKFTHYYEAWMGHAFWKKEENFVLEEHIRFCEETEAHLKGQDIGVISDDDNNNNNNKDNVKNNNNNNQVDYKNNVNEDKNSSSVVTEEDFCRIMGPISTRPFKRGMSPWEILIVRKFVPTVAKVHGDFVPTTPVGGEDEEEKFLFVFRVHHSLSDGYSLLKLILANFSDEDMSKIPPPPVRQLSLFKKIMVYLGIIILSPYYHLKQFVMDVDRNFWHVRKESKLTHDWVTIRSEKVSMTGLKEISKAQKVTMTAVLLTGFGTGIKSFLKKTGQEDKTPKIMRAFAPMPWKKHPMNGLVNHWTLGFLVVPVGYNAVQKRLKVSNKSVQLLKTSPILFTNFGTVPMLLAPPSWINQFWATNWMTTMILSNFPGPNFAVLSFGRYHLEDVSFWVPQMKGTAGMGVGFLSYNGGMRITATIDRKLIPTHEKAELLMQCVNDELRKD